MVRSSFRNTVIVSSFLSLFFLTSIVCGQNQDGHGGHSSSVQGDIHSAGEQTHGESAGHESEFSAIDMILEHISDAHEWHIFSYQGEDGHEKHVSIPLPVIIWDGDWHIFMSGKAAHGHVHNGFTMRHGQIVPVNPSLQKAGIPDLFSGLEGKYVDLSITKNVLSIFISCAILLLVFTAVSRVYGKSNGVPTGLAGWMEPVILFIRDDVAVPNIGEHKADKYLPLLLTIFFFIWFNNLLGLVPIFPGGANVTGNIAVTGVLAIITLLVVNLGGNRDYWMHILWPPGVPLWLKPLLIPVEILGIFVKPFALMMRLFANITAGHIMILSLVSLVFIFKNILIGPFVSVPLALFISLLELLVAVLQAYIFTILSALFIGMAVQEHHH